MPRVLNLYILREIAVPFFLSVVILTLTALLSKVIKVIELMVTHGVGLSFIAKFLLSVMPSFLIYTLPVSFLIGVMVAFTRLSSDSEITAMKASGISLFGMMRPVLFLAVGVYIFTIGFTLYLFPMGNVSIKTLLFNIARTKLVSGIDEKTFYDRFKGMVLFVDHVSPDTGEMDGIFISQSVDGGESNVFFANKGVFAPSTEEISVYLKLYDGTIHRKSGQDSSYHTADFSTYILELSVSNAGPAGEIKRTNRELFADELVGKIEEVKASGKDPAPYIIDLHKRFALPASVFAFAIIGVPLGIQKVRAARFTGFSVAIFVVLIYYVMSTAFEAAGDTGFLNPVLAVWGSDIISALAGGYIFYRAAKDMPVELTRFPERVSRSITGLFSGGKRKR